MGGAVKGRQGPGMFGRAGIDGGGVLAPLERRLEAEQERWFCWLPVLLGCGIGAYFALPVEPSLVLALVPLVVVLAWRGARAGRGTLGSLLVAALLAASVGFALAKIRVEWVRAPVLERQINSAEVHGWVEQVEPKAGGGQRLTLRVVALGDLAEAARPVRVRVSIARAAPEVAAGTAVHLRATLMPPSEPALPGDYDFGRQTWFAGIGAVGYSM